MPDKHTPTILIVDDDEDMTRAISIRLGSLGYNCVTAHDGEEGLACFRRGGIDLMIIDVNMPGLCGFDVGESVRKVSDVPIILITGFIENYPPFRSGPGGVTFVFKPIDWKHLVHLVEARLAAKGETTVSRP